MNVAPAVMEKKNRGADANRDYYQSLKMKILASMILVPLFPFIVASVVSFTFFTNSIRQQTLASLQRIVDDHQRMIESFLQERRTDLEFVASTNDFEQIRRPEALKQVFIHLQRKSNAFVDLGVFDETGLHVAYNGPYELAGKMYSEAEWFREVMKTGYYISDIFLGFRKVPHFVIAITRKENGRFWILRATIDTRQFNEVVEKVRKGKTGEAYIINKEGVFQTQRRSGGELMAQDPDAAKYLQPHPGTKVFIPENQSGEAFVYATAWLKDKNWLLVIRQEQSDVFAPVHSAAYTVLMITVLGIAVIVGVAFYVSGRIIRKMERTEEEKGQLSQQLIMAGRLAEIGEMSSGIAHEINNPLQIIRSEHALIEMILDDLQKDGHLPQSQDVSDLLDSVNQIRVQVDRCGEITQGLLKFARQKETASRRVDLRNLLPDVIRLVAKKAEVEGIQTVQDLSDESSEVIADPSQLQQVLLNLLNNAIYAIVEKHGSGGGGELKVALRAEDKSVAVSVTDNGIGIGPENLEKVFTPFFSTKPVGQGTGLGLSICYGIVEKMGGVMEVASEKGRWTTFTVRLPAAAGQPSA